MDIIKGEGADDYDIVVIGEAICPKCDNAKYCRKARRDVTDCVHFIEK